jgi:hypothetical protein
MVSVVYTWSENKVREIATVCLPWQQWTENSARLMILAYQLFTAVLLLLLLIYGSPFRVAAVIV